MLLWISYHACVCLLPVCYFTCRSRCLQEQKNRGVYAFGSLSAYYRNTTECNSLKRQGQTHLVCFILICFSSSY
ncbi:hypothetical protein BX070DRAFT_219093 [Coemansia spiralis]|nr:hypothetical protein BX070DRAFT_219093 [Coemansia spiralis]